MDTYKMKIQYQLAKKRIPGALCKTIFKANHPTSNITNVK